MHHPRRHLAIAENAGHAVREQDARLAPSVRLVELVDRVVQFVLELHVGEQAEGLVRQQLAHLAGEQRRRALPLQSGQRQ